MRSGPPAHPPCSRATVIRPARGRFALSADRSAALGGEAARGIAALHARAAALKRVPRRGWIAKAGIRSPESVADHSYCTAVMSMAAGDSLGMDTLRMVRMALLHDLAESITGDIVPEDMPAGEKRRIEGEAMREILGGLPEPLRAECAAAWDEYGQGRTAEAAMVREIDKIEMAAQAAAYAGGRRGGGLGQFVESAGEAVSSQAGRALLAEAAGGGGG